MPWPFGTGPQRGPALLDAWIPQGAWRLEHHSIDLAAPPASALAAAEEVRIRDEPVVRALFALRRLHFDPDMAMGAFFGAPPFLHLERQPGREVVFGVLAPERGGPHISSPEQFRAALRGGAFAAIGNFRAEPIAGGSRLWTETWAYAPRPATRVSFAAYWLLVGPFSAWIRRRLLRAAAKRLGAAPRHPGADARPE